MAAGERRWRSPADGRSASLGDHGMQGSAGHPRSLLLTPCEKVSQPGVWAEHTLGPDAPEIHVPCGRTPVPTSGETVGPTFHRELGFFAGRPGPGPAGARSSHGITPGWKQRERRDLSTAPTIQRKPRLHRGPRSAPLRPNATWPLRQVTHTAGRLGDGQAHAW